jgi:glycosyltransferase involved in cell wall biosynthesis
MGQAIDVDIFCVDRSSRRADVITLVSVGRIAPVKNTQMLIDMTQQLLGEDYDVQLVLVGGPGSAKEIIYEKELQEYVKNHHLEKHVHFAGGLAHGEITPYLQSAHVFVSGSQTGSLDKAILEAMACGTPVVACNDSFCDIAAQAQYPKLLFDGTFDDLLKKMKGLLNKHQHERDVMGERLREIVVREHALVPFMDRLIEHLYG